MPATVGITVFKLDTKAKNIKIIWSNWGAGWFADKDGNIVTARHVLLGSDKTLGTDKKVVVTMADDRSFEARVVGDDEKTDVAVLHIDAGHPTPYLPWGGYDGLKMGADVIVIGHPFRLSASVSAGIVSGLHRYLLDPTDNSPMPPDMFQYDAASNPGNSGGPVMDARGAVIGLQESVFSPSIQQPQSVGVNFAVAEPYVRRAFEDIRDYGKVIRGQPGFTYEDATKPDRTKLPMRQPGAGAAILTVEAGSAAARIGLKTGDIIVTCGDTKIAGKYNLDPCLALTHPGDSFKLAYTRGGERHEVELLLGGGPLPPRAAPPQAQTSAAAPQ